MKTRSSKNNTRKRSLFAYFQAQEILDESGRLLFSILNAFAESGYHIQLFDNISKSKLGKEGQRIFSIPNFKLVLSPPSNTAEQLYLFDFEDRTCKRFAWKSRVQIKFDIFSSYRWNRLFSGGPIIMPFAVHPVHAYPGLSSRLELARQNIKTIKVFFSGSTKGYNKSFIKYPHNKLPREDGIEQIVTNLVDDSVVVRDMNTLKSVFNGAYLNKVVIVDTSEIWLPDSDWITELAKTEFFLCFPGICMPMCHNAVEAMAVGSIPIINYPEWFCPPLRHMQTAIVFKDGADLLRQIKHVFELDSAEIANLRNNVVEYYRENLAPRRFVDAIEASRRRKVVVLMMTEKYVRDNAWKLNNASILFRQSGRCLDSL